MAIFVWKNPAIWIGEYDIGGYLNTVSMDYGQELLDASAMGVGATRERVAGFKTVTCELGGFWDYTPDSVFFTQVGLLNKVLTIVPQTGAAGEVCFFYKPAVATYSPGAAVGEVLPFRVTADTSEALKQGTLMAAKASRTSSSEGTPYNLGLLGSGQTMYSVVHVFSTSGTNETLDVTIESDELVTFLSPTTRITHTQFLAAGHEQQTLAGPIATDVYWRAKWVIGGADTPTFSFAVVLAIL